jgi:hypothetical protein
MKKLLFSAAIIMIVTSPALAGGVSMDCKGCDSSALQEVWGPPDVPPAAHPRGYTNSPGYITSYGYSPNQGGGDVGYCMRRFRSYDPRSGTYRGSDGLRHHCP